MRKRSFIDGQIRAYVLLENKSFASGVSMFPALVFTQFIAIVPLKLFPADTVKRANRLQAVCFSIG